MQPLATPDVTLAQLIAGVGTVITALVAAGLADSTLVRAIIVAGVFVVLAAWIIADAIIRKGRANYAAAVASQEAPK